jgi:hypothetical protein
MTLTWYRHFETALFRVHHDITLALDNNSCAVLVMFDLSAAFDVIDHPILIERLQYSYGMENCENRNDPDLVQAFLKK